MATFANNNLSQLYRRGLAAKVDKLIWTKGTFSRFVGIMQGEKYQAALPFGGAQLLKPSGLPFDLRRELETTGGYELDVPVAVPITGKGRVGGATLVGNAVKRSMAFKKVRFNTVRQAIQVQDTWMSSLSLHKPEIFAELVNKQAAELTDWFGRRISFMIAQAILESASDNLTDPVDGLGVPRRSHPNFYVKTGATDGAYVKATFNGTFDATYESNCATALASLATGSAGAFSALDIRQMMYLASAHKIQGFEILKGYPAMPIIFIHSAQARQLTNDPEWIAAQRYAGPREYEKNQLFTNAIQGVPFAGAYVVVDDTIPSALISGDAGYSSARGTVNYGCYADLPSNIASLAPLNEYMDYPRDLGARKPALLVGQGAVVGAQAGAIRFTSDVQDHEAVKEDGAVLNIGWERADIFNDQNSGGTIGSFRENSSSLVYFTNSPA
jgi:hypothetical protein